MSVDVSFHDRVDRAVAIASLDGCENSKRAMWRLIDVYIDAVDAIEAGEDIRSTNLSTMFSAGGEYIWQTTPNTAECFRDLDELHFGLEDASEVLDAGRSSAALHQENIREAEEQLEQGVGSRPRGGSSCEVVALAVSKALEDECQ